MVDQIKVVIAIYVWLNLQRRFSDFKINALNRFKDLQAFNSDEKYLFFDHEYYYDWIQKWAAKCQHSLRYFRC